MAEIVWDEIGERKYETGVDHGVLYLDGDAGVPWNGLVAVNDSISGGEVQAFYFEGIKYIDFVAAQDYQATIEAFSAPDQFKECEGLEQLAIGLFGTHRPRKPFGLVYRTLIGSATEGTDHGYKLHLIYNATVAPRASKNQTVGDSMSVGTLTWTIHTVPPRVPGFYPTAHLIVDSREADPDKLALLEEHLYGTSDSVPYLPDQQFLVDLFTRPTIDLEDGGDPTNVDGETLDGGHPGHTYDDEIPGEGGIMDGLGPTTSDGEIVDGLGPSDGGGTVYDGGTP